MMKRLFIAETDENGALACVWVADPAARKLSVFDAKLHSDKLHTAEIAGASRRQIASWVASRFLETDAISSRMKH
ncbi:MAG: hypothetical protein AAFN63_09745 [Pseudomonadota bacterium]